MVMFLQMITTSRHKVGLWIESLFLLHVSFLHLLGEYHFIDSNTLNDRITSSEYTQRRINFRSDIMERDGHVCVISQNTVESCDAAHLIQRSKGDEVLSLIVLSHYVN